MGRDDVERLVASYGDAWFAHDVDAIVALVSDDVVFHNLTTDERVEGIEAFRAQVAGISERRPDFHFRGARAICPTTQASSNGRCGQWLTTDAASSGTAST